MGFGIIKEEKHVYVVCIIIILFVMLFLGLDVSPLGPCKGDWYKMFPGFLVAAMLGFFVFKYNSVRKNG
jgi:hypothetical protein